MRLDSLVAVYPPSSYQGPTYVIRLRLARRMIRRRAETWVLHPPTPFSECPHVFRDGIISLLSSEGPSLLSGAFREGFVPSPPPGAIFSLMFTICEAPPGACWEAATLVRLKGIRHYAELHGISYPMIFMTSIGAHRYPVP